MEQLKWASEAPTQYFVVRIPEGQGMGVKGGTVNSQ